MNTFIFVKVSIALSCMIIACSIIAILIARSRKKYARSQLVVCAAVNIFIAMILLICAFNTT